VDKVSRRQKPDMNMLFLNVKVRRTHLVSDSLDEVTENVIKWCCSIAMVLRFQFDKAYLNLSVLRGREYNCNTK